MAYALGGAKPARPVDFRTAEGLSGLAGDGAKGLREAVLLALPGAQYILDQPHLKSHLYDTASTLDLEGPARHVWVSDHLDRFWAGEVDQVLASWQARQEDGPNERLRQLIDHVTRFENSVDYGAYGYPPKAGQIVVDRVL